MPGAVEVIEAKLFQCGQQAHGARLVAGGQGMEIAFCRSWVTHIGSDDFEQCIVGFAGPEQVPHRDIKPLLENLPPIRPETQSTNIRDMRSGSEQGHC